VADGRDRLAVILEGAHELQRVHALAHEVGTDEAARDVQPVVVVDVGRLHRLVDVDALARHQHVHALDAAGAHRHDVHVRAVPLQCVHRLRQLHLLEAVGRQHCDAQPVEHLIGHWGSPSSA
jgi:hypothetical protein